MAFRSWSSEVPGDLIGRVADVRSIGGDEETAVRVLVGDFGGIGTVGVGVMLQAQGVEFETSEGDVVSKVAAGETDVVVLDRGMPEALETAARIAAEHDDVRVIVCSLDDTSMLVFPGHGAPAYDAPLDPPRLAAAIREQP